jgi:predicted HTH domain antitoxin
MTVVFDIPDDIEQRLRKELGNLEQETKEAALVELYRQGRITQHELGRALGISRFETEGVLKKHNVTEDYADEEEIERALQRLAGMPAK